MMYLKGYKCIAAGIVMTMDKRSFSKRSIYITHCMVKSYNHCKLMYMPVENLIIESIIMTKA